MKIYQNFQIITYFRSWKLGDVFRVTAVLWKLLREIFVQLAGDMEKEPEVALVEVKAGKMFVERQTRRPEEALVGPGTKAAQGKFSQQCQSWGGGAAVLAGP